MPAQLPPDLSCGFALIDEEHATILRCIEELLAAAQSRGAEAVSQDLRQVGSTLRAHFAREEALMNEAQYPERGRHKSAHDLFMHDFTEQSGKLAAVGLTPDVVQWVTVHMPEWVRFHIQVNDLPLGRYLASRARQGASTVASRAREPAAS